MVNQPIHIITPDGIVRFVNQSWCMIYGVPLEEALVGKHIEHVVDISNFYVSLDDPLNFTPSEFQYKFLESRITVQLPWWPRRKKRHAIHRPLPTIKVMVTSTPHTLRRRPSHLRVHPHTGSYHACKLARLHDQHKRKESGSSKKSWLFSEER